MSSGPSDGLIKIGFKEAPWRQHIDQIVVGKDILELLSSSMYVDPMTIYREYVQNAADSIDEARKQSLIAVNESGEINVICEPLVRTIRIRDNGAAIPTRNFVRRMTAFGASAKRGSSARGFRGVGRLAGLGYCQELIFRSRATGEPKVNELRWDCRKIRNALRSTEFAGDLNQIVNESVELRQLSVEGWPARFFEVELRGVVRHRNDQLLNPTAIDAYLSQVAPVAFGDNFKFASEITSFVQSHVPSSRLEIRINGQSPIARPYRDRLEISDSIVDEFRRVELFEVPGVDGNTAAIGWILHHGYVGALPQRSLVRGLRVRCGDIQVGGDNLLEELFPEVRFNAWSVGEIHILDKRIVPNGRRDHFEQNVHFDNLLNHIAPYAREIARQCRLNSTRRRWQKEFDAHESEVRHLAKVLRQRAVPKRQRATYLAHVQQRLAQMQKLADLQDADQPGDGRFRQTIQSLQSHVSKLKPKNAAEDGPLSHLPPERRRAFEQIFGLIYECSTNPAAARSLVERIIAKLTELPIGSSTRVQ